MVDRKSAVRTLLVYRRECEQRRKESGEMLLALAEISRERATLAYLAMPALHDDDGSLQ